MVAATSLEMSNKKFDTRLGFANVLPGGEILSLVRVPGTSMVIWATEACTEEVELVVNCGVTTADDRHRKCAVVSVHTNVRNFICATLNRICTSHGEEVIMQVN